MRKEFLIAFSFNSIIFVTFVLQCIILQPHNFLVYDTSRIARWILIPYVLVRIHIQCVFVKGGVREGKCISDTGSERGESAIRIHNKDERHSFLLSLTRCVLLSSLSFLSIVLSVPPVVILKLLFTLSLLPVMLSLTSLFLLSHTILLNRYDKYIMNF